MIDHIDALFSNKTTNLNQWENRIAKDQKEYQFLMMLTPLMEFVFSNLNAFIIEKFPTLRSKISEYFLTELIHSNFISKLNIMIIRMCVFEMQIASKEGLLQGDSSEQRFDYFIELLKDQENSLFLLNKYGVLKKRLSIYIEQYIYALKEFFERLAHDEKELIQHYLDGNNSYYLSNIYVSGDTHHQGREVLILEFSDSLTKKHVVYKPHPLDADVAFQSVIHWFNQEKKGSILHLTHIIAKKNYGWCEYISYDPCNTQEELKKFYYRCGVLMMLVYMLNGSDLHCENIIAHGSYPVIIDHECLLSPLIFMKETYDMQRQKPFVSQMGFLPQSDTSDKKYKERDISALGGSELQESIEYFIDWIDIGKDSMHARRVRKYYELSNNNPKLSGITIDFIDYETDLISGFEETYHFILKRREFLLSEYSPFMKFKNVPIRIVLRNTAEYGKLLFESWHPKLLFDTNEYDKYFSWLTKITKKSIYFNKVIPMEMRDLEENNIPYFSCKSDENILFDSEYNVVDIPIVKSGYDCFLEHVRDDLNENDLSIQKVTILNSFEVVKLNRNLKKDISFLKIDWDQSPLSIEELKTKGLLIAKRELDRLIKLQIIQHEYTYWPTIDFNEKTELWISSFSNIYLYDGTSGIALSFAYAAKIFNNENYLRIAQQCLHSIRQILIEKGVKKIVNTPGVFEGIGGIIYCYGVLYRLWSDEIIKEDLVALFDEINPILEKSKEYDIIIGSAGLLAVLLSLQDIIAREKLLPYMKACVEHILKNYPDPTKLPLNQKIHTKQPLLGFAHGVAGIIWSLSNYFLLDPEPRIKEWIHSGLAYERGYFNPTVGNWPDLRIFDSIPSSEITYMLAWCHGAPGIGLSRLDLAKNFQDPYFEQEIKNALEITAREGFGKYTCLCHGNLGNVELFLNASDYFNDPKLLESYQRIATKIITSIEEDSFQCDLPQNFASPGLMTGCAGVAYQLLRIAHPEIVPSILLLKSKSS